LSCDYAVWYPHQRLSNRDAGALYATLCDGSTDGVQSHVAIDAFYSELVAKHPQIDDISDEQVDDHDLCPWSVAFDRSPGHIIMCCVWSKADYIGHLLQSLAKKHGLALYDPQSERVHYPDGPSESKPWWKFW
jgi:hypothetical protein